MEKEIFIAFVGAVAGIVGTYLAAILKYRKDLEFKYDTDLREKRIPEYKELWKSLQPLAKYARPAPVTYEGIHNLTSELRRWYYEQGGLFLSMRSRAAYFALQDSLKTIVDAGHQPATDTITEAHFEMLRQKGSTLRTALTEDLLTRRAPILID